MVVIRKLSSEFLLAQRTTNVDETRENAYFHEYISLVMIIMICPICLVVI